MAVIIDRRQQEPLRRARSARLQIVRVNQDEKRWNMLFVEVIRSEAEQWRDLGEAGGTACPPGSKQSNRLQNIIKLDLFDKYRK